jgi:hypothetical protein
MPAAAKTLKPCPETRSTISEWTQVNTAGQGFKAAAFGREAAMEVFDSLRGHEYFIYHK